MTDNRIVLPLAKVRRASLALCSRACRDPLGIVRPEGHQPYCLQPEVEERDRLLAEQPPTGQMSTDCRDGKHDACTGCVCDHHRHSLRGKA